MKKPVYLVAALLAASAMVSAAPAGAQTLDRVEKRVKKLESEMRAVQRKVFPGSNKNFFAPDIVAKENTPDAPGAPATSPVADLTDRVDALEQQLVALTGQIEQNSFKLRNLETALERFRADAQFRITQLEGGGPEAMSSSDAVTGDAAPAGDETAASDAGTTPAQGLDPIEGEYRAAYGQVVAKNWANAESGLQAFIDKHPKHDRASHAQYWLGRTYFVQDQPVQAARAFLENYQQRPEGDRAAESLLWLGKSLMAFPTPSPGKACEAYGQLSNEFGSGLSDDLKAELAEARSAASCS